MGSTATRFQQTARRSQRFAWSGSATQLCYRRSCEWSLEGAARLSDNSLFMIVVISGLSVL